MKKYILLITSFTTLLAGAVHSQDSRAPLQPSDPNQRNISYCIEVFSMPLKEAATYRRSKPSDQQLYSTLIKGLESKNIEQLNYITLKGLSGEKVMSEAITERYYPAKFSSPEELKKTISSTTSEKTNPLTPSFDIRNIGTILECESSLSLTNKTIDLYFSLESVGHTGQYKFGEGDTEQQYPKFETRRVHTTVVTTDNSSKLLFTLDYAPFFDTDKESKDKVYFLFVTVDVEKSD